MGLLHFASLSVLCQSCSRLPGKDICIANNLGRECLPPGKKADMFAVYRVKIMPPNRIKDWTSWPVTL